MLRKSCLLIIVLFLIPCNSHAKVEIFTQTVKQVFGGSQSADDARIAGIAKAKRRALEQAGTYLESTTVVKDNQVEKDEILALAAAILKTEIVSEKRYASDEAYGIIITARVKVDTRVLDKMVEKRIQDRSLIEKYKELQKTEEELLQRIAKLEKENEKLKQLPPEEKVQEKEILKEEFKSTTHKLKASGIFKNALDWLRGINIDNDYLYDVSLSNPDYFDGYWNGCIFCPQYKGYQKYRKCRQFDIQQGVGHWTRGTKGNNGYGLLNVEIKSYGGVSIRGEYFRDELKSTYFSGRIGIDPDDPNREMILVKGNRGPRSCTGKFWRDMPDEAKIIIEEQQKAKKDRKKHKPESNQNNRVSER